VVSVLPQAAKLTVFEEIKREMNSRLEQSFSLNLRAHQGTFLFSLPSTVYQCCGCGSGIQCLFDP
jgi:hypothetical protein